MSLFDAYGELAARVGDATVAAGRYRFQAEAEAAIVPDILSKLDLRADHRLLEVGCGSGRLLIDLASHVRVATGLDHLACVTRLEESVPENVMLMAGEWPRTRPSDLFDRILAYSVLHYVGSREAADRFIDACVDSLDENGVALIGDLPNQDAGRRFAQSGFGEQFSADWKRQVAACEDPEVALRNEIFARASAPVPYIDDDFVLGTLRRCRERGLEAYVVPQGPDLPFSHTREDIIIKRGSR
jgi:SAM-dependent methyltransferase